jgi:hypothetical protein
MFLTYTMVHCGCSLNFSSPGFLQVCCIVDFPFIVSVHEIKLQFRSMYLKLGGNSLNLCHTVIVLQIHLGALNHGRYTLVACCIAADKHAKVAPLLISLQFLDLEFKVQGF